MELNNLRENNGAKRPKKRLGRGTGSGLGKTSGRGHKGQKSRAGSSINGFEGGQMPIHRRLPKRGFKSINKKKFTIINTGELQRAIDEGKINSKKPLNDEVFLSTGFISKLRDGIRLLGRGEIKSKIEIHVSGASVSAIEGVKKCGGNVILLNKVNNE